MWYVTFAKKTEIKEIEIKSEVKNNKIVRLNTSQQILEPNYVLDRNEQKK